LVCAIFALSSLFTGPALAAELVLETNEHSSSLKIGEEAPFHVTDGSISDTRLIELRDGATRVVTWVEKGTDGAITPYYSLGLRGAPMTEGRPTSYELRLHAGSFVPGVTAPPQVVPALRANATSRLFLVQFVTHPIQEYRDALTALGAQVRHVMHHHAYVVEMDPASTAEVEALDFVRWVGRYHPFYRVERVLRTDPQTLADNFAKERYSILFFGTGDRYKERLAERITKLGGVVDKISNGKHSMIATLTSNQLLKVAQLDQIAYIDRWGPMEPDMDLVRIQGGADELETVAGYTGQGVRGESFDSGFNLDHPDFASRPPLEHGGAVGLASHGTACLGICFGDGTGDPQARGLMPDGQPIAADYSNVGLYGSDRYTHTGELREAPYFAVFQTASVGSPRTFDYTTISAEHDTALFDFDVLHCQSQSNAGNQDSRPQAWAKNVVSGGAFDHYNTQDTSDDCWCNTASIGPAQDGRIKPDLSFYYDDTYTTYTTGDGYGQFGGTSGATPSICGHFGLFFQMWSDGIFGNDVDPLGTVFENRPHMTTAKAFMINTAIPYEFSGQNADMTRVHQGWGVPNVKNLYDLRDKISFIDESVILQNTETAEFNTLVDAGEEQLKVTMTYADPAGNPASEIHRINDLTLKVTSPSGTVYWGNNGLLDGNWSVPGGDPNTVDTVENVFVQNPESGTWLVEVIASEVVDDGHVETPEVDADFALVVSGGTISKCSSDGSVAMNGNRFACEDDVRVRVVDCDLNTDDEVAETISITVTSDTEPGGETITLVETDPASATFQEYLPISQTDGPGVLQVANADTIVATYVDADDGLGGTNVEKTDEATVDCAGPLVSNVRDEDVDLDAASILWSTDELSTTALRYGETIPPTIEETGYGRTREHRIDLDGLEECTVYYYEVESVDAIGNETIDDNAGNFYSFETLGDFGYGPVSCHRGDLQITEDVYSCADVIQLRLSDLDLNPDPETAQTVTIEIVSTTEATPELVVLTETGPNTSTFEGTIGTGTGPATNDGVLQIAEGDMISASYQDEDDGTGAPNLSYDTAVADCVGPAILDLTVDTITDHRATIRWNTDVPADTRLEWGHTPALGETVEKTALTTTHSVLINRAEECAPIYFRVSGIDEFGDSTVADENGEPFQFNAGTIPGLYYRETFEDGAPTWTTSGEWEVGGPQGLGGDPSAAYNRDGVLGHDLSGQGSQSGRYEPNSAESAFSPELDATTWTNSKLIFYRHLRVDDKDDASIWVTAGPGYPIFRSEGQDIRESSFSFQEADLSGLVDGKPSVVFEFRQNADATTHEGGWTIDDFIIKDGTLPDYQACLDCAGTPSFGGATSAFDNDACGADGVTVSWDEAVSWGTGESGTYAVYRGETPDFEPSAGNLVASGVTGLSYIDASAPTDRDLWYVVRAESDETCSFGPANGGSMDANVQRVQVSETTDRPAPGEVSGVMVELLGHAHVRLSWPAAAGAHAYRVYRSTTPDGSDRALLGETEGLVFDDDDSGSNKVNYFYEVVAINACEEEGP
jgi:hypothetical protein